MVGNRSGAYYVWAGLGAVMALVMPLTAVFTAMSVQVVADDSAPLVMLIILGIVSLAAHVLILFGGKHGHESKTYYYFVSKRAAFTQKLAASNSAVRRRVKKLEDSVIPYAHHWNKHNQTYSFVEPGPFDQEVATLLRRLFPFLRGNSPSGDPDSE